MFRRENNTEKCHHEHHDHDHNEVDEALRLAETKAGRKKLLVGGIGNTALMAVAAGTALKSNADATWIETFHNFGDVGYYMIPWLATLRSHLHSERALKWMRGSSLMAAGLAGSSAVNSVYEATVNGTVHPEFFSVPIQVGLAAGNAGIAYYVGRKPGKTTIDEAAIRHAKNDARTSIVAAIGNALAFGFAPFNPVSAVVVGAMTVKTESKTISEATEALNKLQAVTKTNT